MQRKRSLTLAGSILNIIAYAINIISLLYTAYLVVVIIALANGLGGNDASSGIAIGTLIGQIVGGFLISIVMIVLSSMLIRMRKLSAKEFDKKKIIPIFVIVFDFLHFGFGIMSNLKGIIQEFNYLLIISILINICQLVAGILILVDFSKNAKYVKEEATMALANGANNSEPVQTTAQEQSQSPASENVLSDDKIKKLEELSKLRNDGLITEEEYQNLKNDLLK